jgi:phage-related protein
MILFVLGKGNEGDRRVPARTDPPEWRIEFYTDSRGHSPVTEYISVLSAQEQAEVRDEIRLLREFGLQLKEPHVRQVTDHPKLWELRPGANRIFYFAHTGRKFFLLHAYRKKSQKAPAREIRMAEKRMVELLEETE